MESSENLSTQSLAQEAAISSSATAQSYSQSHASVAASNEIMSIESSLKASRNASFAGIQLRSSKSDPCSSTTFRKSTSKTSTTAPTLLNSEFDVCEGLGTLRVRSFPNLTFQDGIAKLAKETTLDQTTFKSFYSALQNREALYINIQGRGLSKIEKNVLQSWRHVVGIDAGDNKFTLEQFRTCPQLEELLLPLNGIINVSITQSDFYKLKMLDLSCNSLTPTAVYALGHLYNLKVLDLSCNNIVNLPGGLNQKSFEQLEVLILDYNSIAHPNNFRILSRLQKLITLSLKNNIVWCLPFIETKATQYLVRRRMKKYDLSEIMPESLSKIEHLLNRSESDKLLTDKPKRIKQNAVYLTDEKNDGLPFPRLKQLSLKQNNISRVSQVLAAKSWGALSELVLIRNPVMSLPSHHLNVIGDYLVPQLNIHYAQFNCRILDLYMDPFHQKGLMKRFLPVRERQHCSCHKLTSIKDKDKVHFNLDVTGATPPGMTSLPLPQQRVCTFKLIPQADVVTKKSAKRRAASAFGQFAPDRIQLTQICESILECVAPSTLPSTIQATKVALRHALQNLDSDALNELPARIKSESKVEESEDALFSKFFRNHLLEKLECARKIDSVEKN